MTDRPAARTMWTRALLVLLAAVAATAAACSGGDEAASEASERPYATAARGLCDAVAEAAGGDAAAARAAFFDGAHQPLHELAAETAERDRAVAARLLEAKQAVEAALDDTNGDLERAFDQLVAATTDALGAIDAGSLPCAPSTEDGR